MPSTLLNHKLKNTLFVLFWIVSGQGVVKNSTIFCAHAYMQHRVKMKKKIPINDFLQFEQNLNLY